MRSVLAEGDEGDQTLPLARIRNAAPADLIMQYSCAV